MVSDCGTLPVIEFLASIDPVSLPVLAALAFSLSLYPLGLMLGSSCSPCCDTPCGECETGKLPDTVTVTFDGYPDTGPPFVQLNIQFSACYGFGAAGTAQVASQPGPITGTTVTNGGSGYAKIGRVEPTVTVDGTGGTGADITVTLTEEADACGIPYWTVSGLTVVDGGQDYNDGGAVVFSIASGDTQEIAASATVSTSRDEPELTIEPPEDTGSGASFTVTVAETGASPSLWEIDSIAVTNGGTGYSDGDFATVVLGDGDIEQAPASLIIRNAREEPELTLTGTADLTVNVASLGGTPEAWEITSITVTDGGSGYSDGQYLNVVLGPDDVQEPFWFAALRVKTVRDEPTVSAVPYFVSGDGAVFNVSIVQSGDVWVVDEVAITNGGSSYSGADSFFLQATVGQTVVAGLMSVTVDESGTITDVSITSAGEFFLDTGVIDEVEVLSGGRFFKDTGVIESVSVDYGGLYYKNLGDIQSVTLISGGRYYREDASEPAYVADVTVNILQGQFSSGSGAELSAVVDEDPESVTFGEIIGVTIDDGGDGYTALGGPANTLCMSEHMNKSFVLARGTKWTGEPSCGSLSTEEDSTNLGSVPCNDPCRYAALTCTPLLQNAFNTAPIVLAVRGNTPHDYGGSGSYLEAPSVGTMITTDVVTDCSNLSLAFTAPNAPAGFDGVTAVVSAGGSVEEGVRAPQLGACGVCCLDQDESPVEITMSVRNLVFDETNWYVPDGDYVLTRDDFDESDFFSGAGRMHWRGIVPSVGFVEVTIAPCSYFGELGYSSGQECEDTCYKKCFFAISVPRSPSTQTFYYGGCVNYGPEENPNLQCFDFPVCKPFGTYVTSALIVVGGVLLPNSDWYEVTFQ